MLKGLTRDEALRVLNGWKEAISTNRLYGFGLSKMMYYRVPPPRLWDHDFTLQGLFDNNEKLWGQTGLGYEILPPARIADLPPGAKIVIFADHGSIAGQLEKYGLKNGQDFVVVKKFWPLLCFYKYNRYLSCESAGLWMTDRCTLRCRHCGNSLDEFPGRHGDVSYQSLKQSLDAFFSLVDFTGAFGLTGGEARLSRELPSVLDYIFENYRGRIGDLILNTNGTHILDDSLLERCQKYFVQIRISDYTESGIKGYADVFHKYVNILKEKKIFHSIALNPWFDMKLSEREKPRWAAAPAEEINKIFIKCPESSCRMLLGRYLYPCGHAFREHKLADFSSQSTAIDLTSHNPLDPEDRLRMLLFLLGCYEQPILETCRTCYACQGVKPVGRARQVKD